LQACIRPATKTKPAGIAKGKTLSRVPNCGAAARVERVVWGQARCRGLQSATVESASVRGGTRKASLSMLCFGLQPVSIALAFLKNLSNRYCAIWALTQEEKTPVLKKLRCEVRGL